jgi:hypothetical protein
LNIFLPYIKKCTFNPLEPSKFFFEFFLQIWRRGVLWVKTGKSKWILAYFKVSSINPVRTPRTFNYAWAVSLVLYEHWMNYSRKQKLLTKRTMFLRKVVKKSSELAFLPIKILLLQNLQVKKHFNILIFQIRYIPVYTVQYSILL